ncbi:hypothetical protein [Campylobacter sp. MG1]|uniref:hypothetical protein n=1 Tax=Campylobacter sp. MG1 TaxID=2976332 RepID=UPI00226CA59B|nr:hypothetical protein [Campylobacter sp. MG1]
MTTSILNKKIAYFQNKLEVANDGISTEWLKFEIKTIKELKKIATSQNKEDIANFISYLSKIKEHFSLELRDIEKDMYGDHHILFIRNQAKRRLHLLLSMKSLLKFSFDNCKIKYYFQRAFWQCGDDDFAFTMLHSLGALA